MKTFKQLNEELNAARLAEQDEGVRDIANGEALDEQTVHLAPHGGKGTHFKVVKGIKGQLENGEVIHDKHIDDLHDVGIKTKILKEDELTEEEQAILEGEDVTDLPFDDELNEEYVSPQKYKETLKTHGFHYSGDQGKHGPNHSHKNGHSYDLDDNGKWHHHSGTSGSTIQSLKDHIAKHNLNEWSEPSEIRAGRKLAAADKPRTKTEEIKIARGQLHGDYKGHAAAMRKKHNITEDAEQLQELSTSLLNRYSTKAVKTAHATHDRKLATGVDRQGAGDQLDKRLRSAGMAMDKVDKADGLRQGKRVKVAATK